MTSNENEELVSLNKSNRKSVRSGGIKENRWLIFAVTALLLTFNTRIYASPHYSTVLAGGDKYGWLCESGDERHVLREGFSVCEAQRSALLRVFSIMMCCENIGCIAGGFLFDKTGPRMAAMIGIILTLAGYLFLINATESFDSMKAGAMFGGLAVNILAFPSLILEDYFPGNSTICAAFTLACQGLGTLVAPIGIELMDNFDIDFYSLWNYYIYLVFLPISVLYIWLTPWKRISQPVEAESIEASSAKSVEIQLHSPPEGVEEDKIPEKSIATTVAEVGASLGGLVKSMTSREYIMMTLVSSFCNILGTYYFGVLQSNSDTDTLDFMSRSMPLDAVYGMAFGKLCDIVRTPVMMIVQLLSYCLLSFMVLMGPGKIQYFAIQLMIATFSFSPTIKYTYVQETFPSTLTGALVGISGSISGMVGLLVPESTDNIEYTSLSFAAVCIALIPIPLYLWYKSAIRIKGKEE